MNRRERIVVVGAGLCGLRAAERLRELGYEGDVVIVGAEPNPPYHRPALSKQLLMGTMRPADLMLPAYQNVNAKWRLNTPVQYLLPRSRTLRLPGDEELKYDGLIIATGVEARRANEVPYEDPRVLVLRTLEDALDMERVVSENRGPVAVVGGGFTGCELASSLRHMGREVTLIGRGKNLLGNVLGNDLGNWLTKMHADHGVDLALGNSVKRWAPREDGVALQLSDGSTMLAGCVLLATGTVPSTAWLRGSGLPLDNGVVCEATTHVVGAEDVVAAGDVAQWPNIRFDTEPRRIEHWLNAIEMGRAAAESLLAGRSAAKPFTPMPRFWTEQYGVRIQAAGVPKLGPEVVALGSQTDGTGTVVGYAKGGRLMGVVGVDCPKSVLAWTDSVARQNPVPGEQPAPEREQQPAAPTRQAAPAAARESVSTGTRRPAATSTRQPGTKRGFAAAAERKKGGRHSIPPREPRRPQPATRSVDWLDPIEPAAAVASAAASSARMMPADPDPRMRRDRSGVLVDSDGKLVENTGRIGRIDANGDLVPMGTERPMGPGDSNARMRPPPANGRVVPPPGGGPAESNARMRPADSYGRMAPGGRPGPEDSYERMPAVPPINDRLRSAGGGRGPRMGPDDSYDRMPPVDRDGRGPADSNGRARPVNGFRPGPEESYNRMPPAGGHPGHGQPPGPVDSYGRLPQAGPVDSFARLPPVHGQAYEPPRLNVQPWDGRGPVGPQPAPRPGPADSYDRMPPARPNFGPVGSDGRLPQIGRGPEVSYDRMPPASRQYGPEDSYDQFPPVRRGPLGPVGSDGRLRPVQRRRP
ncbi:FAD-dependent oxidoreductase [Actinophytocola sp.]|uniref:NAD(P)/FAD-dependent oxidoreductase n=1 Tax=Actinophytocola sp. TaxID=1872138 RepID=UPI003D6B45C8